MALMDVAVHVKAERAVVEAFLTMARLRPVEVNDFGDCGCCWGEKRDLYCPPHTVVVADGTTWSVYARLFLRAGLMVTCDDAADWGRLTDSYLWVDWCPVHVRDVRVYHDPHSSAARWMQRDKLGEVTDLDTSIVKVVSNMVDNQS